MRSEGSLLDSAGLPADQPGRWKEHALTTVLLSWFHCPMHTAEHVKACLVLETCLWLQNACVLVPGCLSKCWHICITCIRHA